MFSKLISLLTITLILCAPILEAQEFSFPENDSQRISQAQLKKATTNISNLKSVDCEHCHEEDCSGNDSCCMNSCGCISVFYKRSNKTSTMVAMTNSSKIEWYFFNNYISPLLDPALKPPLFS